MNRGKAVFAQLLVQVPFSYFEYLVDVYKANKGIRHFSLSDVRPTDAPAMEEALFDVPFYRVFAGQDLGSRGVTDESTLLRLCHLLEEHKLAARMLLVINTTLAARELMLKTGSVVDATIIEALSWTKNKDGQRDPEMHQVN